MSQQTTESLICPITGEIMKDPVMALDGHTYEREAIATWFEEKQTSPLTGAHLESKTLITNHTLRKLLEEMGHETSYSSTQEQQSVPLQLNQQTINFYDNEEDNHSVSVRSIHRANNSTNNCTHPCHTNYRLAEGCEIHWGGETEWCCPSGNSRVAYTCGRGFPLELYY